MLDEQIRDHLANFEPLCNLGDAGLTRLASQSQLSSLKKNRSISAHERRQWLIYLISGEIHVQLSGRKIATIKANTTRCRRPIFTGIRSDLQATTTQDASFLVVSRRLYNHLLKEQADTGIWVDDISLNNTENELLQQIFLDYQSGDIKTPAMPTIALQVRKAASDNDSSLNQIASIIIKDPSLAGKIVSAANQSTHSTTHEIGSVKNAVIQLGIDNTRYLVTSIALGELFKGEKSRICTRMQHVWYYSVDVAATSYLLAKESQAFDPDRTALMGLLHDIGVIAVLSYLDQFSERLFNDSLDTALLRLRDVVGSLIIQRWNLSEEFMKVISHAGDWYWDECESAEYSDVITLAKAHVIDPISQLPFHPLPAELPSCAKLGFDDFDDDGRLHILNTHQRTIQSMKDILKG